MDEAEAHILKYLQHRGFTDIKYEPDGNIPPDFLIDGRIAVEVRRLIQHEDSTGKLRGLTETQIPLIQRLQSLFKALGAPNQGKSWFVFVRFTRPLEDWKTLGPRVQDWLETFKNGAQAGRHDNDFGNGFTVSLVAASKPLASLFVLGMFSDWDTGGWVLSEVKRNLDICIAEKTRKISSVRAKYPEWWFILSDHIGLGLDDFDREQFRATISVAHTWDRIILVNPADHTSAFEI